MGKFDIRNFLTENKLTEQSKMLNEAKTASIGFHNKREIEYFKDMIEEVPAYSDVRVLSVKKNTGPDGNTWWDVTVDISSIFPGRNYETFVNDVDEFDTFFA